MSRTDFPSRVIETDEGKRSGTWLLAVLCSGSLPKATVSQSPIQGASTLLLRIPRMIQAAEDVREDGLQVAVPLKTQTVYRDSQYPQTNRDHTRSGSVQLLGGR